MNILSKLFNQNNHKFVGDEESGNYITFSLNPKSNNEPYIKIKIEDTSTLASHEFAVLLLDIFSGIYSEAVINLMLKMSNENEDIKNFVNSCILRWSSLTKEINANMLQNSDSMEDDIPVITPTHFNKNAK